MPILQHADLHQVGEAEAEEIVGLGVERFVVGLVGDQDRRAIDRAQATNDLVIEGEQAGAGIDDEQDDRGRLDGGLDLRIDVRRQIVDVDDADSARVDDVEVAISLIEQEAHPIAGHAGMIVDDGQPLVGQPVEDAAFADVRSADDHDLGETHTDNAISKWGANGANCILLGRAIRS